MPTETSTHKISLIAMAQICAVAIILISPCYTQSSNWVVESSRTPEGRHPNELIIWHWPYTLGDLDEDNRIDYLDQFTYGDNTGAFPATNMQGKLSSDNGFFFERLFPAIYHSSGPPNWGKPMYNWNVTALKSPNGPQLIIDHPRHDTRWVSYDMRGRLLGELPIPFAPPPYPPMLHILFHSNAGDVNQDGWEDLTVCTMTANVGGPHYFFGVLSGIDFSTVWLRSLGNLSWYGFVRDYLSSGPPDLNSDGIQDILAATNDIYGISQIHAWNGQNGNLLWTHSKSIHPSASQWWCSVGPDVNGDEVHEIVLTAKQIYVSNIRAYPGLIQLLDGATGTPIWTTDMVELDPVWNKPLAPYGAFRTGYPAIFPDLTGDNIPDVVFPARKYDSATGGQVLGEPKNAVYSGVDGDFHGLEDYPEDLAPWNTDVFNWERQTEHSFFGDLNGDGYPEVQIPVFAPSYNLPNNFNWWQHFVTLSRKTLSLPQQAHLGDSLSAQIDLPAAANERVRLIASTIFDPNSGAHIHGFKTHLGQSSLLKSTMQNHSMSSRLDQFGKGQIDFGIPNQPWLAHNTIYLRALAADSSRPGHIRTMTTMATLEILP
jgi:hypothetical protein